MLNKRTNILFDNELWEKLTRLASAKKISVGKIVRTAVEKEINAEEKLKQRQSAIENIRKIRPHLKGKINYKALINYGRD